MKTSGTSAASDRLIATTFWTQNGRLKEALSTQNPDGASLIMHMELHHAMQFHVLVQA